MTANITEDVHAIAHPAFSKIRLNIGVPIANPAAKNNLIKVTMKPDAQINVEGIPMLIKSYKKNLTFQAKGTPYFGMKYVKTGMIERDEENLLQMVEELLRRMEEYLL